jgi:N-succinyldiaminopimelate aminotransferase
MKSINNELSTFKESIFATISKKAHELNAVNLGQGFPDFEGPLWLKELARDSFNSDKPNINQYAPSPGRIELRSAISENFKDFYGLEFDAQTEVTVFNGATETLFCSALALLNPGDEVVVFEPFYDSYLANIKLAKARPKVVTLHAPEFRFNLEELEEAFSENTKMIYLNSPHNPSGTVFTRDELTQIAILCKKWDVYVVSDEVYEHLTFDDNPHIPISTLPGMKERTITISSMGKTFGYTGWKIGWALAPKELSHALRMVHQFNTFSVCHPIQLAVAQGLKQIKSYLPEFKELYTKKRELLLSGLKEVGLKPTSPQGTYFILCQIPKADMDDVEYCYYLIEKFKVATIPPSSFYLKSNDGEKYVRFCFAKSDSILEKAMENLKEK